MFRRFHLIVEPLHHKEFYEIRSYQIARGKIVRTLLYFLRTVLARPDLALRVQVFHSCASHNKNIAGSIDVSILRPEDWKRTRNALCALEQDSHRVEEWTYAVEGGNWDAITTLTIWQLPNLQELTFERWKVSNEFYPFIIGFLYRVRELQETESPSASAMRNLQKIGVYGYNSERNPSPRTNTYLRSEMRLSVASPDISLP